MRKAEGIAVYACVCVILEEKYDTQEDYDCYDVGRLLEMWIDAEGVKILPRIPHFTPP